MEGRAYLKEQAERDFSHARRKAVYRRVAARLRRGVSVKPASFGDAAGARRRVHRGRETVPLDLIVGTVSRNSDFDGVFLPTNSSVAERWKSLDLAFLEGKKLPPVTLYAVGGEYFVFDGSHRVSVARYHGVKKIEAEVFEFVGAKGRRKDAEPETAR